METTLLTKENAHRVTMVRRVDAPESEPVAFLFRGKRYGYLAIGWNGRWLCSNRFR